MEDHRRYALPSEAHRGDLDINKALPSGDFEASELINAELADSMSFYYEKDMVSTTWLGKGSFYPNAS